MKNQALFSSKDKSKKLKCRLLQFLFGTLRVKISFSLFQDLGIVLQIRKGKRYNFGRALDKRGY